MITINTSYGYDRLSLKIGLKDIFVCQCPLSHIDKLFHFEFVDTNNKVLNGLSLKLHNGLRIPYLLKEEGFYYLNIYIQSDSDRALYVSYTQPKSIKLQYINNRLHFSDSQVLANNNSLISSLKNDTETLNFYKQSNKYFDISNKTILALALKITRNCITARQKAIAIHDWISTHIYYDYDAIKDGSYAYRDNSAIAIIRDKRCVCTGFSYLMITLLRAVGIPAFGQRCYALNISNDGDWDYGNNKSSAANHMIALAFIEDKWRIFDVTWDCFNSYQNNTFHKGMDKTISRIYFDCTVEFISHTHRFC